SIVEKCKLKRAHVLWHHPRRARPPDHACGYPVGLRRLTDWRANGGCQASRKTTRPKRRAAREPSTFGPTPKCELRLSRCSVRWNFEAGRRVRCLWPGLLETTTWLSGSG